MRKTNEIIEDEPITKLTAQLDNSVENRDLSLDNPVNVKEIYTEIDNILMNSNRKKKSNLIGENVKGIIIANWFNNFMVKSLGAEFRFEILDELINDKLTYIISMDKTGLNELGKGIASLSPQITSIMAPNLIEKMTGLNDTKKLR